MSKEYWAESLEELFGEYDLVLSGEDMSQFVSDVMQISEMEYEASGLEHISNPLQAEVDNWKRRCKELEKEVDTVSHDFRKNVSMRRGCDISDVILEGNGHATIRS